MPSNPFRIFNLIGKAKYFHSIIIKWISFCKVQYIEFDFITFSSIAYSKEKPLCMSICIDVILKYQIIFEISNFYYCEKIAWFKSRLKYQCFIIIAFKLIKLIRLKLHAFLHLPSTHTLKISFFTINIMLLNQFFNINKIGSSAEIWGRLINCR